MQERRAFAETGHAMRLLEGVAAAVARAEPVLLVGETGTGKTAIVQHLAEQVRLRHIAATCRITELPGSAFMPCFAAGWTVIAILRQGDSSAGCAVLQLYMSKHMQHNCLLLSC
jgi:alpha-D-ribose 1-methylphosphonate 5-triphosphate synthase subunit PhnL